MIELYELRQFAAFADCGTLSEAAEILHLSQPALSRSMKKIEEEIGVSLFIRRKNRLELNENGAYVVELAKKVLADADALAGKAQAFDRKKPHDFPGHLCPGSKLGAHTASQQPVSRQNAANGNCGGKRFAVWS